MNGQHGDLARTTVGVMFIGGLALASLWVLQPFLPAFIWATTIVVATWPMLLRMQIWLHGRRTPAVVIMTLIMLMIFVVPLLLAIGMIAKHSDSLVGWIRELPQHQLPPPPAWIHPIPLLGERAVTAWQQLADNGLPDIAARLQPYARDLAKWLVAEVRAIGLLFVQCLLIVVLSAVLYWGGESWAAWMLAFGRRLADQRGTAAVILAGRAIRGVALGVVVTALVQSLLGGIGIVVTGVPFAGLLTALLFILCIAQLGPLLMLLGCTVWLFANGENVWGSFLLVWSIGVSSIDNVLRPLLIRRGADLPLLLIFAGVIGGLLSFGLVGLFVGPVILAVTYTLVDAWVHGRGTVAN